MMDDHASVSWRFEGPRNPRRACAVLMAVLLLCGAGPRFSRDQQERGLPGDARPGTADGDPEAAGPVERPGRGDVCGRRGPLPGSLGGDGRRRSGPRMGGARDRRDTRSTREVVPTTPAGCGQATATFTQSTPVAIPTGPAVVTSTLVVSGAGPYLFDLDLTTNIRTPSRRTSTSRSRLPPGRSSP